MKFKLCIILYLSIFITIESVSSEITLIKRAPLFKKTFDFKRKVPLDKNVLGKPIKKIFVNIDNKKFNIALYSRYIPWKGKGSKAVKSSYILFYKNVDRKGDMFIESTSSNHYNISYFTWHYSSIAYAENNTTFFYAENKASKLAIYKLKLNKLMNLSSAKINIRPSIFQVNIKGPFSIYKNNKKLIFVWTEPSSPRDIAKNIPISTFRKTRVYDVRLDECYMPLAYSIFFDNLPRCFSEALPYDELINFISENNNKIVINCKSGNNYPNGSYFLLNSLYKLYLSKKWQNELKKDSNNTDTEIKDIIYKFCNKNNIKLTKLLKTDLPENILIQKIIKNKNMLLFFTANKWLGKNHRLWNECTASESEIKKFYDDFKWAFMKKLGSSSEYHKLIEVKKDISKEIKRLKYYRLDELLSNPPKVKIMWEKPESSQKKSKSSKNTVEWRKKHMSREEWTRVKGAPRSLEKLFTKSELEKLFKPIDYKSIKDKYELAQAYDRQGNFIAAFKVLKKLSNSRNLPAKLLLANYLQRGRKGIKNNLIEARKIYQKIISAVQSKSAMPTAQEYYLLGLSLKETNPKPKASAESIKAFEIAANGNYAPALCRLGECYWDGYSVRQNMKKGKKLLTKSADMGYPRGMAFVSSLYLSSGNTKGLPLVKKSVIAGDEIGQYCLGVAYLMGVGLKKNKSKAKFWLQKSADQGCVKAINLLKKMVCEKSTLKD